jgi:hypothetical protein
MRDSGHVFMALSFLSRFAGQARETIRPAQSYSAHAAGEFRFWRRFGHAARTFAAIVARAWQNV